MDLGAAAIASAASRAARCCEAARREGVPAFEKDFSLFDVYGADEAFTTGTFAGLVPVASVDGRTIGEAAPSSDDASGPMTRRLRAALKALEAEEAQGSGG